jgi:glutamine amidotransferase
MNILVSNPEYLLAVNGAAKAGMGYRVFQGRSDFDRLFGESEIGRMRMPDFAASHISLVASDFEEERVPAEWTAVPDRAIVTFTRVDDPQVEAI